MASKPPGSKKRPTIPKAKSKGKPGTGTRRTPKTFAVEKVTPGGEGEKIVLYGQSGIGKTTLVAQRPSTKFVPLDDGVRKIVNPITGDPVMAIPGVETWDDLRDAVRQRDLFDEGDTVALDTITKAEAPLGQWVVNNIPTEKGGTAKTLEHFGFGKGYRHMLDELRNLLTDLDALTRRGVNVILLAQLSQVPVANAEGVDYLQDGPKLCENKMGPLRTEVCEWADHVIRLGYLDFTVQKDSKDARAGKVEGTDATRAAFTGGALHFLAKSRPVTRGRKKPYRIPPVVPFDSPEDDSLWAYVFEGAVEEGGDED